MLYAFIVTASYGGNLRGFLTNPGTTEPINTVKDMVSSELPWNIVLYGEDVEYDLSVSQDPLVKKLWDKKEVVVHQRMPYERVSLYIGATLVYSTYNATA